MTGSAKVKDQGGKYIKIKAAHDNKGEGKLSAKAGKEEKQKTENKVNQNTKKS